VVIDSHLGAAFFQGRYEMFEIEQVGEINNLIRGYGSKIGVGPGDHSW
jgi:hypothetical protein